MSNAQQHCPTCGKALSPGLDDVAEERAGSLTSFLLSDLTCSCRVDGRASDKGKKDSKLCARCHKVIPEVNRVGSLTSFFFRDIRCQCKVPAIVGGGAGSGDRSPLATKYVDGQLTEQRQKVKATAMAKTRAALAADAAAFIDLSAGQIIGGAYKLISLAGQGGMGSVYRARHLALNRECAVKFVAPSMVSQETWRLFQKEAKIISSLSHPTICQVYDLGIHGGSLPFYVMDFVNGTTLDELITRQGPFSVGATIELYLKVLDGLSYAHRRGVVHKDIKPANIMVQKMDSGDVQVRILDFGISELSEKTSEAEDAPGKDGKVEVMGSAPYMSPEQFSGRVVDKTSDIYSVGCSMFETLTGSPPFRGKDFRAYRNEHFNTPSPSLKDATGMSFSSRLEAIIAKCLEKRAEARYQSAGEMSIDLQRLLEGKSLQFAKVASSHADESKEVPPVKIDQFLSTGQAISIGALMVVIIGWFGWQLLDSYQVTMTNGKLKLELLEVTKRSFLEIYQGEPDREEISKAENAAVKESKDGIYFVDGVFNDLGFHADHVYTLDKIPKRVSGEKRILKVCAEPKDLDNLLGSIPEGSIFGAAILDPALIGQLSSIARLCPHIEYLELPTIQGISELKNLYLPDLRYLKVNSCGDPQLGQALSSDLPVGLTSLFLPPDIKVSKCFAKPAKAPLVSRIVFSEGEVFSEDLVRLEECFEFDSIAFIESNVSGLDLVPLKNRKQLLDVFICGVSEERWREYKVSKNTLPHFVKLHFLTAEQLAEFRRSGDGACLETVSGMTTFKEAAKGRQAQEKSSADNSSEDSIVMPDLTVDSIVSPGRGPVILMKGFLTPNGMLSQQTADLAELDSARGATETYCLTVGKDVDLSSLYKKLNLMAHKGVSLKFLKNPDRQLRAILSRCPGIEFLHLDYIGPETFSMVGELKQLKCLCLSNDSRTPLVLPVRSPLSTLAVYNKASVKFEPGAAGHVQTMILSECTVNPATIESINQVCPETLVLAQCAISRQAFLTFCQADRRYAVKCVGNSSQFNGLSAADRAKIGSKVDLLWRSASQ